MKIQYLFSGEISRKNNRKQLQEIAQSYFDMPSHICWETSEDLSFKKSMLHSLKVELNWWLSDR